MIKKRAEGKPFYVYMTAGANKFLRIYCGKVNAYAWTLHFPLDFLFADYYSVSDAIKEVIVL